jgi:transcriptional regulator with XRE-family HTH domain
LKEFSDVTKEEIEYQYKLISENIKKFRLEKKLTQEKVALSMGFTTATFYTNAESCKREKHFSLEHIIKIAKILDVQIEELFKDHDNKKNKIVSIL